MIAMGGEDAFAALAAFSKRTRRIVWISSGDVYGAYARLTGLEEGEAKPGLLTENSPLRTVLFPYRKRATAATELNYFYEKILVERAALQNSEVPGVVLRLPKVYGPAGNSDLATVYRYRHQGAWRWTHGYVENVAAAIALAATHPAALGRIYNVGEPYTPTVAERLADLPPSELAPDIASEFRFQHNIAYDTSRIRRELGFEELVSYGEGLQRTLKKQPAAG
jgi:nucleoside-diphosphate-sugar epimerase